LGVRVLLDQLAGIQNDIIHHEDNFDVHFVEPMEYPGVSRERCRKKWLMRTTSEDHDFPIRKSFNDIGSVHRISLIDCDSTHHGLKFKIIRASVSGIQPRTDPNEHRQR
jgi:hypothetical protein